MPSSSSEARSRFALLASMTLSLGACATAMDSGVPLSHNYVAEGGDEGDSSAGRAGRANGGSGSVATGGSSSAGKSGAAAGGAVASAGSGTSGAPHSGGAPTSGSAGKSGASNGGTGSGGTGHTGGAGKGGTSSAGSGAGKGGSGASAGSASAGSPSAGSPSAGSPSTGGAPGSTTCDAAHALATITTNQVYTGKANDCVRLAVNPTWSTISLQFQPLPGTGPYPVPFSFFSCGGNGTGSLTTDYMNVTFKTGANPGCDYFVQFEGGATTIKVTYYD